MLKQQEVDDEEERLRRLVNNLSDEKKRDFYNDVRQELRDPDTYAALNWFFLAGLHHFYLGRWAKGFFDLLLFVVGIVFIVSGYTWTGIILILLVSAWEMWALFRSQIIIQDWNNGVYRKLLKHYEQ